MTERKAIILEYEGGRVEYSPEVEVTTQDNGTVTLDPITPFRTMAKGQWR